MVDLPTLIVSVGLSIIASVAATTVLHAKATRRERVEVEPPPPVWTCELCSRPFVSEYDAIDHARDTHAAPTDEDARDLLTVEP